MMNSIFRKWVAAYLAIAFAGIIVFTAAISWLVQKDFYRQGLDQLNQRSIVIEQLFEVFQRGDLSLADFKKSIKGIERDHDVKISIIGKRVKYLQKALLEVGVRPDVLNWITIVSDGTRIEKIRKFRQQDNEQMLIIGFPLKIKDEVVASAFVYSPVHNADQLAKPIRRSIWLIALASAGPLILLLWFATRRLVGPIKQMSKAAASVAEGDFSSRVRVYGKDEIAQLGSAFNSMAERIERIEDQRRQLITELTHELRTPLTSIRASLQAMSEGILSAAEQKEFADLSLAESQRLGRLIDNLQELSAFEEHKIQFVWKRTELTELVKMTVLQFQPQAEQSGMRLILEADREKAIWIEADPERLKQVLVNLIGNAIYHNPEGTQIEVSLSSRQRKANIVVRDNGRGIAREHLPHLFDRLYKAESSRSSKGSGVGLTISRYIVLAHGGTIKVVSEPGNGTEMHIEFPLDAA